MVGTASLPSNQYRAPSAVNINDFDFIDPAILVVGGGKSTNALNNSGIETRSTSTLQPMSYEDEARLWLLMQQSASAHQDPNFLMQETQSAPHQELRFSGLAGDGFSPTGDDFGISSRLVDQHQNYGPSSFFAESSQQKYGNRHISNGYLRGLDDTGLRSDVGTAEIQRNERLGLNKLFPGYGDITWQMPSRSDVYSRVYGL